MLELRQITILGTGLLGGSLGLALRHAGYTGRIVGVGRRQATVDRAAAMGCLDSGGTDVAHGLAGADLAVLAVPVGAFPVLLAQVAASGSPSLVVTDVGSTKAWVCRAALETLGPVRFRRFIGSHPMAGSEQQGPDAARADLFRCKPCILTPAPDADPEALAVVESLWTMVGMKLIRMGCEEHDQAVAAVSHVPHAMAALLVELAAVSGHLNVGSSGFRDTTRVASGDPSMWADIFITNRPAVVAGLRALRESIDAFAAAVRDGDREAIVALLSASKAVRDQWAGQCRKGED